MQANLPRRRPRIVRGRWSELELDLDRGQYVGLRARPIGTAGVPEAAAAPGSYVRVSDSAGAEYAVIRCRGRAGRVSH
jgi:hypothetical protein